MTTGPGSRYDLAVAYRIYPEVSKPARGLPFGNDKYLLAEACLQSFIASLGPLRVKMWALLDGCPAEYETLVRKYVDARDLVVLRLDRIGNQATFARQIDILLEQNDAGLVYFAEDDYFYLPGQFPEMIDFLASHDLATHDDVDFVSPYDHPDCYHLDLHQGPKSLRANGSHHWRTAASTCLTFLARKELLQKHEAVFRSYVRGNFDCSLWLSLTKHRVFNPVSALRYVSSGSLSGKILAKAWRYGWRQILFGEKRRLWVPVPGIATHLDARALSPAVDWTALMGSKKMQQAIEVKV
jgi:hypothetical protein